jgi:hypothetical protein
MRLFHEQLRPSNGSDLGAHQGGRSSLLVIGSVPDRHLRTDEITCVRGRKFKAIPMGQVLGLDAESLSTTRGLSAGSGGINAEAIGVVRTGGTEGVFASRQIPDG